MDKEFRGITNFWRKRGKRVIGIKRYTSDAGRGITYLTAKLLAPKRPDVAGGAEG